MSIIESLERQQLRDDIPQFKAGDTVRVHFRVIEGSRQRVQVFEGIVIKRQGSTSRETFTVRKQSFGTGVERTFPLHSPEDREDRAHHGGRRAPRQALLPARQGGEEGPRPREAALAGHERSTRPRGAPARPPRPPGLTDCRPMATTLPGPSRPRRSRAARRRAAPRLFAHDRSLGARLVAGADEAGRGCLAGPLVAAAVCLDLERLSAAGRRALADLDDSKRLRPGGARAPGRRPAGPHAAQVVVVSASPATIDRDGLHRTNLRLLRARPGRPAARARGVPGRRLPPGPARPAAPRRRRRRRPERRDRRGLGDRQDGPGPPHGRSRAAEAYPAFGFDRHVGYATPEHHAALRADGLSPLHRRSFQSVAYPRPAPLRRVSRRPGP